MKTTTKALLAGLCAILLVAGSVFGTLAYLTETTGTVTNTFTVGKILAEGGTFELKEHLVALDAASGSYKYAKGTADAPVFKESETDITQTTAAEVAANTYTIFPGTDIPKDPFVRITKLEQDAYLFIEVKGTIPTGITGGVNATDWTKISDVTGAHGGDVYYYKTKLTAPTTSEGIAAYSQTYSILANDKLTVAADATISEGFTLNFYGYLVQAVGFTNATAAWKGAYPEPEETGTAGS